jgi:uncharacterized NAD(P)/FAD-binding protein YdhS
MSARPDDPDHLVHWARGRGHAADAGSFLPRPVYGAYLADELDAAAAAHPGRLRLHRAHVTVLRPGERGVRLRLDDGRALDAAHAVVATGGPVATRPGAVAAGLDEHPGYVADPWRPDALADLPAGGPVLLLGTGLTAVDVALTLATCRPQWPVEAVSRRGLLPQAHIDSATADRCAGTVLSVPPASGGLATLLRAVRRAADGAADWRTVVDGLRPRLDTLWRSLSPTDQDRFLRHVARHWENRRHRMAPTVACRLARLRDGGQLRVRAGGVRDVRADGSGLAVTDTDGTVRRYAAVVNCTGPGRLPHAAGPLVRDLLEAGIVAPGPHGLGLGVDDGGRLLDRSGRAHPRLWTIGPLRRGHAWETTAVPEIRAQAAELAAALGSGSRWSHRAA